MSQSKMIEALTREQIEGLRTALHLTGAEVGYTEGDHHAVNALCDMALASLTAEAGKVEGKCCDRLKIRGPWLCPVHDSVVNSLHPAATVERPKRENVPTYADRERALEENDIDQYESWLIDAYLDLEALEAHCTALEKQRDELKQQLTLGEKK